MDAQLAAGLFEIAPQLGFSIDEAGVPVICEKGEKLCVTRGEKEIQIVYGRSVEIFRGLSLLRGLAVGEVEPKDIGRVLWKELRIGAVIGIALAIVNTLRIFITYHGRPDCLMLALVTGITLIAVVLIAKSLGCALPLAAKKMHLDPALMASPLLATVCDTCVVLIYFNIATLFMNIMG